MGGVRAQEAQREPRTLRQSEASFREIHSDTGGGSSLAYCSQSCPGAPSETGEKFREFFSKSLHTMVFYTRGFLHAAEADNVFLQFLGAQAQAREGKSTVKRRGAPSRLHVFEWLHVVANTTIHQSEGGLPARTE